MKNKHLIVGLGNPGKEYDLTRHNIGFRTIDLLKKESLKNCILLKPKTFMNRSGSGVVRAKNFYKINPENIIVIHDDFALPLGLIRIKQKSSAGGHNGVQSIIDNIGTDEFIRIKIGIAKAKMNNISMSNFVLGKFTKTEKKKIDKTLPEVVEAVKTIIEQGIEKAMNVFN